MRNHIARILGVLLVLAGAWLALGAMADTMLLKAEGGEAEVVTFQHKAHAIDRAIACTLCHHNMAEVGTPLCGQCHVLGEAVDKPTEDRPRALGQAFHDSCLGCHREPPKGTTPPVECAQCHVDAKVPDGSETAGP